MPDTATNSSVKIYSFGMIMPGRSYNANSGYRFGFNKKEDDNEIDGIGNSIDFGARIYDSRLGRWWGVDASFKKHPDESPFISFRNNPIHLGDPDGNDPIEGGIELSINLGYFAFDFTALSLPSPFTNVTNNDYKLYKKINSWFYVTNMDDIISLRKGVDAPKNMKSVLKDWAKDRLMDAATEGLSKRVEGLINATFSKSYLLGNFSYSTANDKLPSQYTERLVQNVGNGFESIVTFKEEYSVTFTYDKNGHPKDMIKDLTSYTSYTHLRKNPNYNKPGSQFKDYEYLMTENKYSKKANGTWDSGQTRDYGINKRQNTKSGKVFPAFKL